MFKQKNRRYKDVNLAQSPTPDRQKPKYVQHTRTQPPRPKKPRQKQTDKKQRIKTQPHPIHTTASPLAKSNAPKQKHPRTKS